MKRINKTIRAGITDGRDKARKAPKELHIFVIAQILQKYPSLYWRAYFHGFTRETDKI